MPDPKEDPEQRSGPPPALAHPLMTTFQQARNIEPPEELRAVDPDSPRGRILKAARELFAEHGFDGTSTRAVSERAEVNLAMIHYYYSSKEQLYDRVLVQAIFEVRQAALGAIPENALPEEALVTIPIRLMTALRADTVRAALLRREIASGGTRAVQAIQALGNHGPLQLIEVFREAYRNAAEHGLVRNLPAKAVHECLISIAFSALLFGPMLSAVAGRDFSDDQVWEEWQQTWSVLLRQGLLMEKK
jgi:AcrR family transcriptional regulator